MAKEIIGLTKRVFRNLKPDLKPEKVYCVYCHKNVPIDKAQPIGNGVYRCRKHEARTILKNSKLITWEVDNG